MKSQLFLVTYAKDYEFTSYTLRSIDKFGQGFAGLTMVVPTKDEERFKPLAKKHGVELRSYFESESKGFLHHQVCKCEADLWCPRDTDFIFHIDADCVFKEPFSPQDFLGPKGKPVLVRERFDDFEHYKARNSWRHCAEYALGVPVEWETMVRHPGVFWKSMYREMRDRIEERHHYPFTQYVLLQRNEFPQSFAEFPTLGGFALNWWSHMYEVATQVKTPSEAWRGHPLITPVARDDRGYPVEEIDIILMGNDSYPVTLKNPVHYFWSRGGVTPEIRRKLESILG